MKFLLKGEIDLPNTKWDWDLVNSNEGPIKESESSSLTAARYLYGPDLINLDLESAKMCIGRTVYCIGGQTWHTSKKSEKKKEITKLVVLGFTDDGNFDKRHFRHDYRNYDDIAVRMNNDQFGIYDCGKGTFVSGSGCDPIYVFARP